MATGDLKGCLRKLEQGLRLLSYPREVDYAGLAKGDPAAFLPIMSYAFISYSAYVAEHLVGSGVELTGKNDMRFVEAVFKVLRDEFQYKPVLTKQQFLQCGFTERKIQMVSDTIHLITKKHKDLANSDKTKHQAKKKVVSIKGQAQVRSERCTAETAPVSVFEPAELIRKPLVERHTGGNASTVHFTSISPAHIEDCQVSGGDSGQEDSIEVPNTQESPGDRIQMEMESMKCQLSECQANLQKLNIIEERLKILENKMKGMVIVDEKDWTNLLSRVVLLETELLIRSKKMDMSLDFNSMIEDRTSSRMLNQGCSDTEAREESTEKLHYQSSGYSSLLSTDTSPKTGNVSSTSLTEISKVKETTKQRMERINKLMTETEDLLKCADNC
ncbi:centrosomal protein of 44 kDa isoform X1 [Protopterus annectens]|uniref:centrosomal protein of 44 kDa isoform X1 n=1 Tax=Protopterus annectens TaxID=7888 RepID=UPI001CFA4DC9|nr:centrosomal protein of 44 kDa isoform X1 [Protopterus annectens]